MMLYKGGVFQLIIPETYFYNIHLDFSTIMFGVFLRETDMVYHVLVNVEPYKTRLRFLSKQKYSKESHIPVGGKVEFDESGIKLTEYFNCYYCCLPKTDIHLSCSCPARNIVSATGKLIEREFTFYDSKVGLKVTVRHGEITSHFIVFPEDAWFDVVKKMNVGDDITFKAVLSKYDHGISNNNFVKLYHIKL